MSIRLQKKACKHRIPACVQNGTGSGTVVLRMHRLPGATLHRHRHRPLVIQIAVVLEGGGLRSATKHDVSNKGARWTVHGCQIEGIETVNGAGEHAC